MEIERLHLRKSDAHVAVLHEPPHLLLERFTGDEESVGKKITIPVGHGNLATAIRQSGLRDNLVIHEGVESASLSDHALILPARRRDRQRQRQPFLMLANLSSIDGQ